MITFFFGLQAIRAVEYNVNSKPWGNFPLYNNTLKVTKNVGTKLLMEVRRFDRRAIIITQDKRYYLNVISDDGERFLLRKQWQPEEIDRGRFSIFIEPEDLDDLTPGRYNYSISYVDADLGEQMLYTNEDPTVSDTFIVEHSGMPLERPPFVQFKFTKVRTRTGIDYPDASLIKDTYISSRLPLSKPVHSIEMIMDNFKGKLKVQATRDPDPNQEESWFDIEVLDVDNESTPILLEFADTKYEYLRLQIEYFKVNEGTFDEIRFK